MSIPVSPPLLFIPLTISAMILSRTAQSDPIAVDTSACINQAARSLVEFIFAY